MIVVSLVIFAFCCICARAMPSQLALAVALAFIPCTSSSAGDDHEPRGIAIAIGARWTRRS